MQIQIWAHALPPAACSPARLPCASMHACMRAHTYTNLHVYVYMYIYITRQSKTGGELIRFRVSAGDFTAASKKATNHLKD